MIDTDTEGAGLHMGKVALCVGEQYRKGGRTGTCGLKQIDGVINRPATYHHIPGKIRERGRMALCSGALFFEHHGSGKRQPALIDAPCGFARIHEITPLHQGMLSGGNQLRAHVCLRTGRLHLPQKCPHIIGIITDAPNERLAIGGDALSRHTH